MKTRLGFTLLEVLIAMLVASLAISAGAAMFLAFGSHAVRVGELTEEETRTRNAESTLVRLLRSGVPFSDGAPPLIGTAGQLRWTSWCDAPDGGGELCSATLRLVSSGPASYQRVELTVASLGHDSEQEESRSVTVTQGARALVYLADPSGGGVWVNSWSQREPPWAVGLVTQTDTILYLTARSSR